MLFRGDAPSGGFPDAGSGPCDEDDFVFESVHFRLLFSFITMGRGNGLNGGEV